MKRIIITIILLALVCMTGQAKKKPIVWEEVAKTYTTNPYFEIRKVELTKQQTRLLCRYSRGERFRISTECYLQSDGEVYPVTSADSITLGEWQDLDDSGQKEFILCFKPLPLKTQDFDFLEGLADNDFKVFAVHDKDTPLAAAPVPEDFRADYAGDEELPELQYDSKPATVRFRAINLRKGMKPEIRVQYIDLKNPTRATTKTVRLNEESEAEISLPLGFPQNVDIELPTGYWYSSGHLFLAPGKEVTVLVDMLRDDDERKDSKFVGFKGYLAKLDKEYTEAYKDSQKGNEYTFPKQRDIKDMTALISYMDGRAAYMEEWKKSAPFMKQTKEVCQQVVNMPIFMSTPELDSLTKSDAFRDYLLSKQSAPLHSRRMFLNYYFVHTSRYYAMDKEARGINADLARYCYYLPKILDGQNVGKPLIEDKSLSNLYDQTVSEYQKTLAAQKEGLPPNVHYLDMTDVKPEDILQTILDRYKGKAVLIDVWATWCGPCRRGHKEMAPLKEQLKGSGIEFVYITSPTSPYKDWKDMIGDITGEHYYLTKEQYMYLLDTYRSSGIPTYTIYDAAGKQTYTCIGFPGIDEIKEEIEKVSATSP